MRDDDAKSMVGPRWEHDGLTASPIQVNVGFRKRRTAPAVELRTADVRVQFLSRDLATFFDGATDNLEGSTDGQLFYLYRVSEALPPAAEQFLADVSHGSITLLAASHRLLTPVVILGPAAASEFGRWFHALP